jgi:hypothetical protein|nr:MAG TPA: PROTEIN/RNA Complex, archaeal, ribosomal, 50S, protein.0A [Caudoviricetes sp.]
MAMVACRECNAQISSKAKVCPHCGVKRRGKKLWLWIPLGLIGCFVLILIIGANYDPVAARKNKRYTGRLQPYGTNIMYVLLDEPTTIDGYCEGWKKMSVQGVEPGSLKKTDLLCWKLEGDTVISSTREGSRELMPKWQFVD